MTKTPLLALVVLAACGADPVGYSAPVGIELKVKSSDVPAGGTLTPDKGITTESGNPYGAFVNAATAKIGHAPSSIELDKVTLTLGAQSTNVSALEQVVTGDVFVNFLTNDTNNTFVAAHFGNPTGMGPVQGHSAFDWGQVGADADKFLGGSFKVVLNAPAAPDFAGKGADASLQVTFTFSAFE